MAQSAARPTIDEVTGSVFAQIASRTWNTSKSRKFNAAAVEEIYSELTATAFAPKSFYILDQLSCLEKFLWPNFSDDASDKHAIVTAALIAIRATECLDVWKQILEDADQFSIFFRRVTSLMMPTSSDFKSRYWLLTFVIAAFRSLDNATIRKSCAPLVSVSVLQLLSSSEKRDAHFAKYPQHAKAWRTAKKKLDSADVAGKAQLHFERSWLISVLFEFLQLLQQGDAETDVALYCERFVEFLVELASVLPTRRYLNVVLADVHLLVAIKTSPHYKSGGLSKDLISLLDYYVHFPIDDNTGIALTAQEQESLRHGKLQALQRVAFQKYPESLKLLSLANFGALNTESEILEHFEGLSHDDTVELCSSLGFRTQYPANVKINVDRKFLMEVLVNQYKMRKSLEERVMDMPVMPTEKSLFDHDIVQDEMRSVSLPRLGLQYLTIKDFLWRCFRLSRAEGMLGFRKHIDAAVRRLEPYGHGAEVKFNGSSKWATPIAKPAILEVVPPAVGEDAPSSVKAEIRIDLGRMSDAARDGWESLQVGGLVFLLVVKSGRKGRDPSVQYVRTAEVMEITDQQGRPIRESGVQKPSIRLLLDTKQFKHDHDDGDEAVYDAINVVVRGKTSSSTFKPVLENIKALIQGEDPIPDWLANVFLGYGDPNSAHYRNLDGRPEALNVHDTFLDWNHIVESFQGKKVIPAAGTEEGASRPYIIREKLPSPAVTKTSKKRSRAEAEGQAEATEATIEVESYKLESRGPFPTEQRRFNSRQHSPAQVEAITSGTNPGLTVVSCPPGTGDAHVAAQVASNIYQAFPQERTVIVAKNKGVLNRIFENLAALDIANRHLLRFDSDDADVAPGKVGRVEYLAERRMQLLSEVQRLAYAMNAPGAHGNSCETASYFADVYVKPAWRKFKNQISAASDAAAVSAAFPFHAFFAYAPQPLFSDASIKENISVAEDCYKHMQNLFEELGGLRPLELLKRRKDKLDYLLTKEARIIALTSEQAITKCKEFIEMGFRYDSVIIPDCAYMSELEAFSTLALQSQSNGVNQIKRLILLGDDKRAVSVVQDLPTQVNFNQSLFSRLMRLGVPVVHLDKQSRTRFPELFSWRYHGIEDSSTIKESPEFSTANAGFRYDYQLVHVADYKEEGEVESTPGSFQNLGEAEYAVAIFQYMRLLGYPAQKITILSAYTGQQALINGVLDQRCTRNPLYGVPARVATIDELHGEHNDYVIFSSVRTKEVDMLRDARRMTAVMSSARLGLYVLGRQELFQLCRDIKPTTDLLLARPTKLQLVTGEMYPTKREVGAEASAVEMEGVEHLGAFVYEMSKKVVEQLKAERMA
ncbi:hypothetical protein SAICODRAFT_57839 [Saitoella complicata NRRL Y-17804]|uniref:Pre-mRNA-splicing factor n=1 Tax=Saitoella complicata (strain BCRC 22490 / CBS 7301 / JCM 7358 / NBRC 10748 / NRRL Y-17804) TaxID=698492 RepID=A0A0E9NDK8_SAICN|nr:uncharacterized protein SAICODRAFT_57839 [Saitoella complicata NRRL Y-17804]ODQ52545.1 hypothetical protein SAICODRAFT_57839 [Saitoella complicata NRRL Y-17804]GAO47490.1 hypothetical protein G7K_1696-t1 [Saitoella complicata NRRL Y-17804]